MGDARRRKLGEPAPASIVSEPAPVVDIASARPAEPTVKPIVQARVLDFLNAMALEGFHVERVTLDVRAYGRLLVELASNAKSVMPGEPPDAIHMRGPTGGLVVLDYVLPARPPVLVKPPTPDSEQP